MSEEQPTEKPQAQADEQLHDAIERVHWWVVSGMQTVMGVFLVLALYEQQWLNAVVIVAIFVLMGLPKRLSRRLKVQIPAEFEMLALLFVFASLFLGEARGYYVRFAWWDVMLHTLSGLLLGIFGFLLVYVLNQHERVEMHMKPYFVALFAFLFAVAVGAVWEIFEFTMDQVFGLNMQKPMFGDDSGLTDTMWDLIVDTLGALIISLLGWLHLSRGESSFMMTGIRKFVERNPHMFQKKAG